MEEPQIRTGNDFLVGYRMVGQVVIQNPITSMTPEDALRLAAWLLVVVGDDERFAKIVNAIRGT